VIPARYSNLFQHKRPGVLTNLVVVLACALMLGACTPWPEYATGGLAERHPTAWAPMLALQGRYNALTDIGTERFYPARLVEIRNLINRAMREREGGLAADAEFTLTRAAELVSLAENDMRKLKPGSRSRQRG
jgi:hypothetical protein